MARANGKKADLNAPVDYYLEFTDGLLTLHFTLPLKTPAKAQSLDLEVDDPTYFVDFSFAEKEPVRLIGAPAACKIAVAAAGRRRRRQAARPARRSVLQQPRRVEQLRRAVRQQDNGEMPVNTLAGGRKATHLFLLARADRRRACRTRRVRTPSRKIRSARRARRAAASAARRHRRLALAKQAEFYRMLSGTIRSAKTDGSAVWLLMGISFAYGIFHAAGPGHGKAVISSYLVANEETWKRGVDAVVPLRHAAGAGGGRAGRDRGGAARRDRRRR